MISVMASGAVDRGFEPRSGLTKDYEIGIFPFSAAVRRKSKDWLAQNQDNVYDWGDMYIHGLLFRELTLYNQTECVRLVESGLHHHLIEN